MPPEHLDVLVVGAGLSGLAAACHLRDACPRKSFAVLEAREDIGGTWDLFRYPGVRSDSDMFTLGFSFRPWLEGRAIAGGEEIRRYLRNTAREHGIDGRIRLGHRVVAASWSSAAQRWSVEVERAGAREQITCGFLIACTGYFRYDRGHLPDLPGAGRFCGRIVHPQEWSDDIVYAGKRVVIVGSGATAVTLLPALAAEAEHVTMLQRTPTYIMSLPARDAIADVLRRALPPGMAHRTIRWKNVLLTMVLYNLSKRAPGLVRRLIRLGVRRALPAGFDVDTHFRPPYDPWDQRICFAPDGDFFRAIRRGRAAVVTDEIETLTPDGVRLRSGRRLPADLVVMATGLQLLALGGMELTVDGEPVRLGDRVSYRGAMLAGVPNLGVTLGYVSASWTLKCELVCEYVCRLLNHMDTHGHAVALPQTAQPDEPTRPFVDFTSGYIRRAVTQLPRQGERDPWRVHQNYLRDIRMLRHGRLDDAMTFVPRRTAGAAGRPPALAA